MGRIITHVTLSVGMTRCNVSLLDIYCHFLTLEFDEDSRTSSRKFMKLIGDQDMRLRGFGEIPCQAGRLVCVASVIFN